MPTDHVAAGQAYSLSRIRLDTLFVAHMVICGYFDLVSVSLSLVLHHARISSQPHLSREIGIKEVMVSSTVSAFKPCHTKPNSVFYYSLPPDTRKENCS